MFPSLSPDGEFIVYASNASGNWDILFQRVDGETALNLTEHSPADDTQPAFSPDGKQIAFRSERDGGGIFLMGATGESPVTRATTSTTAWVCAAAGNAALSRPRHTRQPVSAYYVR